MQEQRREIGRFVAFDGLRGLFSLLVVLAHFPGNTILHGTLFHRTGSTLVDMFFVFSGFVIAGAFERPLANGYGVARFVVERLGRIYPIHLVVLMAFVATELVMAPLIGQFGLTGRQAFEGSNSVAAILSNLALVHSLGIHDQLTWNYPSWSLSTEWGAYLFFAAAMAFGPRRFWPFAIAGIVVSAMVLVFIADKGMASTYDYGLYRSIYGFCLGALGHGIWRKIAGLNLAGRLGFVGASIIEVLALALLFGVQMALGNGDLQVLVPVLQVMVLLVFAMEGGVISAAARLRPLVHLGLISLSVYVIHAYVLLRAINLASLAERVTGIDLVAIVPLSGVPTPVFNLSPLGVNLLAMALTLLVVAISHFTYKHVEMPGQRLFRRLAKKIPARKSGPVVLAAE